MTPDTLLRVLAPVDRDPPRVMAGPPFGSVRVRLRPAPRGWRKVGVHRVGPNPVRHGWMAAVVRLARSSGVLELGPDHHGEPRLLDQIASEAGAELAGAPRTGWTGAVVVAVAAPGGPAILRIGPGAAAEADALEALAAARELPVPRLVQRGITGGLAWVVESALDGRRPHVVDDSLIRSAAAVTAAFPSAPRAQSWRDDVAVLRERAPHTARAIDRIETYLAGATAAGPGVLRHGDFWSGNLLTDAAGAITGVVDWDAWQPAGLPGTDLLHLVTTATRHHRRVALGTVFLDAPWRSAEFGRAFAPYADALGVEARPEYLDAVGVAWWLGQVAGDLRRTPAFTADHTWMAANIDAVLASRALPG